MPPLQTQQDLLAESDLDKARSLNQQFCPNFSSEDLKRRFARMPNIQVTESAVLKLLAGLKPSKAAGPDGLHPTVLKEVTPVITPALAFIFQKCSRRRTVAPCLRTGALQMSIHSSKKVTDLLQPIISQSLKARRNQERNPNRRKGRNLRN